MAANEQSEHEIVRNKMAKIVAWKKKTFGIEKLKMKFTKKIKD